MLVLHKDAERAYGFVPVDGLADARIGMFPRPLLDEARQRGRAVIRVNINCNTVIVWSR